MINVAYRLAEALQGKPDGDRWSFIDGPLSEAFVGVRDDGLTIVSYRGENYVRQKTSLRVRLHNWIVAYINLREPK